MIGFFIKKAFYDGWDNLLALMSVNIAMLAVGFGGFFLAGFASRSCPCRSRSPSPPFSPKAC